MTAPIKVVVLDDHDILRGGVRAVLEAEGDMSVVHESATVGDALPAILSLQPDVVVLEPMLPDGSGIDLVARLRAELPSTRCLVLARDDPTPTVLAAINAGAAAYLLKRVDSGTLRSTVKALAAGHAAIDPALFRRVLAHVEQPAGPPELDGLNDQQVKILELIGRGLTNREIGEELYIAEKTVKNNVTRILAQLGVQRRTQAALVATRVYQS